MPTCCELLTAEHRLTEELLASLEARLMDAVAATTFSLQAWQSVEALYQTLADDLYRHFATEEQALFSLLSQYRSMMLMEVEYYDLLALQTRCCEAVRQSIAAEQPQASALPAFRAWKERLLGHILEEERGVFPLAASMLDADEQQKSLQVYQRLKAEDALILIRPVPGFQVQKSTLFAEDLPVRPMRYETLYDREHVSLQHVFLDAGTKQALHWAGQQQCMILISGRLRLHTAGEVREIEPGDVMTGDSRMYFALEALEASHVLMYKAWPHPHYTKRS